MASLITKEILGIYKYRYVVFAYVQVFLKLRYRRSYLGFVWTVLAPMLHYIIIGVVFSILMRGNRPDYFAYYFSGAVLFSLVNGSISRSMMAFIGNEHFIKKISIPKLVYILQGVSVEFANFFLSSIALLVLGLLLGLVNLSWALIGMIYPVFLLFLLMIGIGTLLAILSVYFRDILNIVPAAMQALFFATPILYDQSMLPVQYHWIIKLNPLYYLLLLFREPLLAGGLPSFYIYLYSTLGCVSVFVIGIVLVRTFDNRIIFKL